MFIHKFNLIKKIWCKCIQPGFATLGCCVIGNLSTVRLDPPEPDCNNFRIPNSNRRGRKKKRDRKREEREKDGVGGEECIEINQRQGFWRLPQRSEGRRLPVSHFFVSFSHFICFEIWLFSSKSVELEDPLFDEHVCNVYLSYEMCWFLLRCRFNFQEVPCGWKPFVSQ